MALRIRDHKAAILAAQVKQVVVSAQIAAAVSADAVAVLLASPEVP